MPRASTPPASRLPMARPAMNDASTALTATTGRPCHTPMASPAAGDPLILLDACGFAQPCSAA
jgi:hypothetical protein